MTLEIHKDGNWQLESKVGSVTSQIIHARMHIKHEWRVIADVVGGVSGELLTTVVIAQSKNAPADTVTSTPETVASAPAPVASEQGSVLADFYAARDEALADLTSNEKMANFLRVGISILESELNPAPLYDLPLAIVPPATEKQVADALLPFEAFDDSEGIFKDGDSLIGQANIWTHVTNPYPTYEPSSGNGTSPMAWSWLHEGTTGKPANGHGRTSRNRAKTRQNASNGVEAVKSVKNAGKRQNGANKGIVVMMERNPDKQAEIRAAYANRKQRPVAPVIQIAEILRSMGIGKAA